MHAFVQAHQLPNAPAHGGNRHRNCCKDGQPAAKLQIAASAGAQPTHKCSASAAASEGRCARWEPEHSSGWLPPVPSITPYMPVFELLESRWPSALQGF